MNWVVIMFSAIGVLFVAIVLVAGCYWLIKPFVRVEDPKLKDWAKRKRL